MYNPLIDSQQVHKRNRHPGGGVPLSHKGGVLAEQYYLGVILRLPHALHLYITIRRSKVCLHQSGSGLVDCADSHRRALSC